MAGTQTPAVLLLITSDPRGRITQLPIKLAMIDGVEFCSLPSGLHLYLTKDGLRDMYIFTQRQTSEKGQRGFHLSSLGILLARSFCPRPWHHVPALKALGNSSQDVWEPVRRFFGLRKARLEDLGGAGAWHRWSEELEFDMDDGGVEDGSDGYEVLLTGTLVGKQSQVDDSIIAYAFDKALPGDSNGAWPSRLSCGLCGERVRPVRTDGTRGVSVLFVSSNDSVGDGLVDTLPQHLGRGVQPGETELNTPGGTPGMLPEFNQAAPSQLK
ncbi:hypothetical protein EDB89DRAFT_2082630 [Lactarius sanguifluus]|nr:hypothetical protein EDB89DRAFT_2082630 [Lactarius sanguifluus]